MSRGAKASGDKCGVTNGPVLGNRAAWCSCRVVWKASEREPSRWVVMLMSQSRDVMKHLEDGCQGLGSGLNGLAGSGQSAVGPRALGCGQSPGGMGCGDL